MVPGTVAVPPTVKFPPTNAVALAVKGFVTLVGKDGICKCALSPMVLYLIAFTCELSFKLNLNPKLSPT